MRNRVVPFVAILGVILLALPAMAAKPSADRKTAPYSTSDAVTVGTTHLKPGTYSFEAIEGQNQIEILRNGKQIGTAACHWVKLPTKARDTSVETDAGRVTEVNFEGNDQAVKIG